MLEICSVLSGIVSVILTIRQNIYCWVFGLISCVLLTILFYQTQFYGQMSLQIISIIQCFYGLYMWYEIYSKKTSKLGSTNVILGLLTCTVIGILFTNITKSIDDYWYYLDGVGGIIAIWATYLLVVKKIESWWIYMINNTMIFFLGIHQELYYVSLLNLLYFIISIKGYREWKKNLNMV